MRNPNHLQPLPLNVTTFNELALAFLKKRIETRRSHGITIPDYLNSVQQITDAGSLQSIVSIADALTQEINDLEQTQTCDITFLEFDEYAEICCPLQDDRKVRFSTILKDNHIFIRKPTGHTTQQGATPMIPALVQTLIANHNIRCAFFHAYHGNGVYITQPLAELLKNSTINKTPSITIEQVENLDLVGNDFDSIWSLIAEEKLTVERALRLEPNQLTRLANPAVAKVISNSNNSNSQQLPVDDFIAMAENDVRLVRLLRLQDLIIAEKLAFMDLERLTPNQAAVLEFKPVIDAIIGGVTTVDEIKIEADLFLTFKSFPILQVVLARMLTPQDIRSFRTRAGGLTIQHLGNLRHKPGTTITKLLIKGIISVDDILPPNGGEPLSVVYDNVANLALLGGTVPREAIISGNRNALLLEKLCQGSRMKPDDTLRALALVMRKGILHWNDLVEIKYIHPRSNNSHCYWLNKFLDDIGDSSGTCHPLSCGMWDGSHNLFSLPNEDAERLETNYYSNGPSSSLSCNVRRYEWFMNGPLNVNNLEHLKAVYSLKAQKQKGNCNATQVMMQARQINKLKMMVATNPAQFTIGGGGQILVPKGVENPFAVPPLAGASTVCPLAHSQTLVPEESAFAVLPLAAASVAVCPKAGVDVVQRDQGDSVNVFSLVVTYLKQQNSNCTTSAVCAAGSVVDNVTGNHTHTIAGVGHRPHQPTTFPFSITGALQSEEEKSVGRVNCVIS